MCLSEHLKLQLGFSAVAGFSFLHTQRWLLVYNTSCHIVHNTWGENRGCCRTMVLNSLTCLHAKKSQP